MTANIELDPPLFNQTVKALGSTNPLLNKLAYPVGCSVAKPLQETPKQRRRRQKKAKHRVAKLFRTLEGGPYMEARLIK